MYCAVIGDIVKSKEIENRSKAQIKLNDILKEINEKYSEDIGANFIITIGDEFQGILKSVENVFNIIQYINDRMYPVEIRYGIGIGNISTEINKEMSIGADGPAFYNARDAISEIKTAESKYEKPKRAILIKGSEKYDSELDLVNEALALCRNIEISWTIKQREIIVLMKKYKESQIEIAKELGINRASVNRSVAASAYYNYKNAMDAIEKSLNNIWERRYKK